MLDTLLPTLQLLLPLIFLMGALPGPHRWHRAITLNITVAVLVAAAGIGFPLAAGQGWLTISQAVLDAGPSGPGQAVAVLAALLGAVVAKFAWHYLQGEPDRERFLTQLQVTLTGVVCVLLTDHFLVLWVGWALISLSLHKLLLFYPDRPRAVLAAHKKFLLARSAELLLLAAAVLLYAEVGTFQLSEIRELFRANEPGVLAQAAAVLIAAVALIKCAQLPVHGWLIQVVEAPTPVSALLHAGVINLGGYLLISFAPLLSQVPAAQWLLLIVAGLTMALGALIMSEQMSVKARLAWSTSAQMGLMLVQCAVGLYTLALLHLFAHSFYKAYSFLSAGSAVEITTQRMITARVQPSMRVTVLAIVAAMALVTAAAVMVGPGAMFSPWLLLASLLALTLVEWSSNHRHFSVMKTMPLALLIALVYVGQKQAVTALLPGLNGTPPVGADLWLSFLIVALTGAYLAIDKRAKARWSRGLAAKLAAGFYIDEWFTRVTLWVWPLELPSQKPASRIGASINEVA